MPLQIFSESSVLFVVFIVFYAVYKVVDKLFRRAIDYHEIKKLGYSYITDYVIITPDEISIYENQIQEDKKEAAKEN